MESLPLKERLNEKVMALLSDIEQSETYQLIAAPDTHPMIVVNIVKYILQEVFSYSPHVTEATYTAGRRLPKSQPDLMRPMILHELSGKNYGEQALQLFVQLGGDETRARSRRMSPSLFAMAATSLMLAERAEPFAYLGAAYLFESLTQMLMERVQHVLAAKRFQTPEPRSYGIQAKENLSYFEALTRIIQKVVRENPNSAAAIEYGFDCFAVVYPLLSWQAALEDTRSEYEYHGIGQFAMVCSR